MLDKVSRNELLVTVDIGGVTAIREYPDLRRARRAEATLKKSGVRRLNFFKRPVRNSR
jgi:hypothetical protein